MMDASSISISSHNVQGLVNQKEFIHSQCSLNPLLIQCIQEHWLPPPYKKKPGTNSLRSIHTDFESYATSAMKKAEENSVRRGRGFGGTGFIYPKSMCNSIRPMPKYAHERVTVMELQCLDFKLIIINAYLPYLNRSDLQNAVANYDEIIGFIDFIISDNPEAHFIVLGDFNCNIYDLSHPFTESLNSFVTSRGLVNAYSLMSSFQAGSTYTRYDSRSTSLLDYIFMSPFICDRVSNVSIGHFHDNHSDHLPVVMNLSLSLKMGNNTEQNGSNSKSVLWSKLSPEKLDGYYVTMEQSLDFIEIPNSIIHGQSLCCEDSHKYDIETYCSSIVEAIRFADETLDRCSFRALKPYWSRELSELKRHSFITHKTWLDANKPSGGVVYDSYISARINYRRKLRQEKAAKLKKANDGLYAKLMERDYVNFWRGLNSLSQSRDPLPPQIDGFTGNGCIADHFSDVFSDIFKRNDASSHDKLKKEFESIFPAYFDSHIRDDISQFFFTWQDMIDMLSKLKAGKSYSGLIKAEHILHGSPKLAIHLHILFNAMLQHSYIPTLLLRGDISPLVKDRDGNMSDSANYRAITLSSIFIQMFESLQKAKFGYFLPKSDYQFGFRPGVSTSHALFSLKNTVDYFTKRNSRVFLAFLDCSKAFDRISHWGLFLKLMKRNVPLCFLMSVIYLYSNMSCVVKWNGNFSRAFDVPTGTKQGGILSPDFFGLYVHDLIDLLISSGYGCRVIRVIIACLFFADDVVLLSPSRHGLQMLLNICVTYCRKFCLDFNIKKSKVMVVGKPRNDSFSPLILNNEPLEFVTSYKYLGVELCTGKSISFSAVGALRSFHRAANAILYNRVKPNNDILIKVLYSNCVPIITFASAVREFSSTDMRRCHVAINNCIRKIFSFAVWQSIRHIRLSYGYKSIYEIFALAKSKFLNKASSSSNTVIRQLLTICDD